MKTFCVLFLTLAVSALAQQQPTCDFKGFHECLGNASRADHKESGEKRLQRGDGDRKDNPVKKCFVDAGCQNLSHGENLAEEKTKFETAKKCKKDAFQSLNKQIEQCVAAQNPGFKFPTPKENEKHGHEHRHHKFSAYQLLNKTCTTDASKVAAKACLDKLPKPEHNETNKKERHEKFCKTFTTCKATLTPDCQQKLGQLKQFICTCAKSTIASQGQQFDAKLKSCFTSLPAHKESGEQKDKKGSPSDRLMKLYCKEECKN